MLAAENSPLAAPALHADEFQAFRQLLNDVAGIRLHEHKAELVRSRLLRRLRALSLVSFRDYLERVKGDRSGAELTQLIDALTTNTTSFYREPHHFELLEEELLPRWRKKDRRLRIWSAGCSRGHEPYSIAITLLETQPARGRDERVLATDISTQVLAHARSGEYSDEEIEPVPAATRARHFERVSGTGAQRVVADTCRFRKI